MNRQADAFWLRSYEAFTKALCLPYYFAQLEGKKVQGAQPGTWVTNELHHQLYQLIYGTIKDPCLLSGGCLIDTAETECKLMSCNEC